MRIIVLFNLRPETSVADYEEWADKMESVLGSDAAPPYQYIEVVDVADETLFGTEVAGETMQRVAAEFQKLADNPTFITTSQLGV